VSNKATTTTTIQCKLSSGKVVTLNAADCEAILNALARRKMLTVNIEGIPSGYTEIWTENCYAISAVGDDEVTLVANATDFISAVPVVKAKKKGAVKK